jgi:hypothetical protein
MSVVIPTASAVDSKTVDAPEMEAIVATLKSLEAADLFKVMKQALGEAEKRTKGTTKGVKGTASSKKAGSMPKGVVPAQLRKPRAWVEFVLAHALQNGWESFTVHQTHKDKTTGVVTEEEIEMPASILHDGAYVYEDSVTEKMPSGKQLIPKDAMSLSKQYWAPKDKTGTRQDLYEEFEAQYVEEEVDVPEASSVSSSKIVVKMTAAEKAAAAEAKKAEKEAEKAEKKAAKEAEKAEKKAEKEAEKAAKKAEKEAEKAAKKAEKEAEKAAKKGPAKAVVPAAAVKKAASVPVKAAAVPIKAAAVPVKAAAVPVKAPVKKPVAPKVEEWSCPSDGMVHPWSYKGKNYLRNSDNEVWVRGTDGGCGDWQGVYLPAEDRIDDSVPEPSFDDEE